MMFPLDSALRWLNTLLAVTMVGFAAVQYNDPDALRWSVYYLVPAFGALAAVYRPSLLRSRAGTLLLWFGVVAWVGLLAYHWPTVPGFWRTEVFMEEETAREALGLMIACATLLIAALTVRRRATS